MSKKDQRKRVRALQRQRRVKSALIWGGAGLIVLVLIGILIARNVRPSAGEAVPLMPATHVPLDSDPGAYNTDPPTSGPHYAAEAEAGFYESNIYRYPAGYLVHNLEHGYVIIWYNCAQLSESTCAELKAQIRAVMDELGGIKLIAYPWPSLDVPVALTSWGRLQKLEHFDPKQVKAFYRANLNRAPEPNAP